MLPVVERFIRYAKIHTESDRETGLVPSTPGQLQFASSSLRGDAENRDAGCCRG